jgi:hypothetical protein|nr:MAG TPA: hypothetical protein [Bacteriophage sp.]
MENNVLLSKDSLLVVSTVIQGTKTTIDEIQEQKNFHSSELNLIRNQLELIERNMLCQNDLATLQNGVNVIIQNSISSELTKLEAKIDKVALKTDIESLKVFIKENVAMKSDVDSITRKTIDWVNENTATKADVLKSENTLFWKIAGVVTLIVGATAAIVKMG